MKNLFFCTLLCVLIVSPLSAQTVVLNYTWEGTAFSLGAVGLGGYVTYSCVQGMHNTSGPESLVNVPMYLIGGFAGMALMGFGIFRALLPFEIIYPEDRLPEDSKKGIRPSPFLFHNSQP